MVRFLHRVFTAGALSSLISIASAQSVTFTLSDANGKNQIKFESQAPVEYIEGTADGIAGTIVMDPAKPNLALRADVSVPVNQMRTGNDMRDEHMRSDAWLNADKYPGIKFELNPVSKTAIVKKADGYWIVKADGMFTLKGVTKPVMVPIVLKQIGKKIIATGRFSVHLEDYGVNGPIGIKMIGMKVSPDVQVSLNLVGVEDPGWGAVSKK